MSQIPANLLEGWDILVVDDEDDSLEVARYILDFYGANVLVATSGQQALDVVKDQHPRFIISDLSMPEMDGWELMRKLQDDPATNHIPVIALTAHAMKGDGERALLAGFHNYLTKPLTADTFIHELVRLLMDIPVLSQHLNI
ncbi:MAG TPA: response regulator [Phototrophicaceae bacterium]|jgi:CheY-like chemotaxis protein|nr:response regulator [Phototrophicaceae bacterium]